MSDEVVALFSLAHGAITGFWRCSARDCYACLNFPRKSEQFPRGSDGSRGRPALNKGFLGLPRGLITDVNSSTPRKFDEPGINLALDMPNNFPKHDLSFRSSHGY